MAGRGQGQTKQQQQKSKTKSEERPCKRTHSEVSNDSVGDAAAIHIQLDEMTEELGKISEDLKMVLKKDDIESLISRTVTDIVQALEIKMKEELKRQVKEACKPLQDEIDFLKFEKKNLEDELRKTETNLNQKIAEIEKKTEENEKKNRETMKMANYNEQYSRKNNVKIMGVPEETQESEKGLTDRVCSILKNQGVELDKAEIMAIHRLPARRGEVRPVLIKTINNNAKSRVMRKRKEMRQAGNRVVDDVTKLNTGLINRLYNHEEIDSAWFFNGSVFALTKSKERIRFDLFDNVTQVIKDFRLKRNKP